MTEHGDCRSEPANTGATDASVADLQRWVQFGGTWRVDRRDGATLTLALCRCDGGEQVDTMVSADPDLLAFVAQNVAQD